MGHHGYDLPDQLKRQAFSERLGATGERPHGTLNKDDEGEIRFGVSHDLRGRVVILNFGKPVAWMAATADQASDLADCLIKHANAVRANEKMPDDKATVQRGGAGDSAEAEQGDGGENKN